MRVAQKWPDLEGHTIAYFADCVDADTGTVLAWDLTADRQFEAPLLTARKPYTRKASGDEQADARDELRQRVGDVRISLELAGNR